MALSFRFSSVVLLCAALAFVACASADVKLIDCSGSDAPVKVTSVELKPDPAVAGKEFSLSLRANGSTPIRSGVVYIFVFYRGLPVHFERDQLCEKTDKCPIKDGESFIFSHAQTLPDVTPSGSYTVRITAWDQDSVTLFCSRLDFDIVKPRSTQLTWFERIHQHCSRKLRPMLSEA